MDAKNKSEGRNYFLRDTNSKLAILLPQTNVKNIVFSGAVLWNSAFLYIDQRQAKSLGFEGWLQTILPEIYTVLT